MTKLFFFIVWQVSVPARTGHAGKGLCRKRLSKTTRVLYYLMPGRPGFTRAFTIHRTPSPASVSKKFTEERII